MRPNEKLELEYLRFFYEKAYDALGSDDADNILEEIEQEWLAMGNELPDDYDDDD